MIKIVFYGTGNFAAECFRAILSDKRFDILAVITQPDRPAGRKRELTSSPVKIIAQQHRLPIYQPVALNNFDAAELHNSDLGVVAEYGLIIPKKLLDLPNRGTVNLHASILPQYRGTSPIQTAIMNGDRSTGVTLMLMDEKMDHGPILAVAESVIGNSESQAEVFARLSEIAGKLFLDKAQLWVENALLPKEQDNDKATYCNILKREDGRIKFSKTAKEVYDLWRGLTPWPGIWTTLQGKRLKLYTISVAQHSGVAPGTMVSENGKIIIGCAGNSSIYVHELQLEGKNKVTAGEFINGYREAINFKLDV